MNTLGQDLRFALRLLVKNPVFAGVVVITLALCIGLNTAIFSIVNAMIYFTLPFPNPDRLIRIYRTSPHAQDWPHAVGDYLDFQEQNQVFEQMAAFTFDSPSLMLPNHLAESLQGMRVSANFFDLLGMTPRWGRAFYADENQPGKSLVVMLREGFWRCRLGGDTNLLGRTLRLGTNTVTLVGIVPERIAHFRMWGEIDVWRPLTIQPADRERRDPRFLHVLGRLKSGVSVAQAHANLSALATRIAEEHPNSFNARENVRLKTLRASFSNSVDTARCHLMLAIAGCVLLIGCVNVANLQLARAAHRTREMSIRAALGATRSHLLRQLLTESAVLVGLGLGGGLLLASWGVDGLGRFINAHLVQIQNANFVHFDMDGDVLAYSVALAVLTALLFGLVPALRASRPDVHQALKEGGTTASASHAVRRLRGWLVVSEVAVTLVLLVGCGLFGQSIINLLRVDPGFQTDHRLAMSLRLPSQEKYVDAAARESVLRQLLARMQTLPGVRDAGFAPDLPLWEPGGSRFFQIQGRPPPPPGQTMLTYPETVSPGFFHLLGMSVQRGRDFTDQDTASASPVVIINETMARTFWPHQSPLGQRISTGHSPPRDWAEIVGVVNDVKTLSSSRPDQVLARSYKPFWQTSADRSWLVLHTAVEPESLVEAVRRTVAELEPDMLFNRVASLERFIVAESLELPIIVWLLASFALLGLLLAALGVYGVIAYAVSQRTHEIGIRLAVGAPRGTVLRLLLRQGMRPVWVGLAVGLAGSYVLMQTSRAVLYGIPVWDIPTLTVAIVVLVMAAALACYLPARRATRIEPMQALRCE
ncbi:MAG: ABC transporter permease [Verrucomicrobia bacterium]|nr:ABC transporter permease [Verrucomicrobiota bacterium]